MDALLIGYAALWLFRGDEARQAVRRRQVPRLAAVAAANASTPAKRHAHAHAHAGAGDVRAAGAGRPAATNDGVPATDAGAS